MRIYNIIFLIIILLLASCKESVETGQLLKEDKFTLPIGNMDNELDFFSRDGIPFSLKSDIFMNKGIFYISNGNGKKIMKFNSYGNLLKKISPARQSETTSHYDNSWTFNKLGSITVNSKDYIYAEDTLEYEIAFIDNYIDKSRDKSTNKDDYNKHVLNEKIVSIFDNDGNYINYIGQDGLGGRPFPFINDIFTDNKDRLIVVTQTTYYWTVYRYNMDGDLIDTHVIDLDHLPRLENESESITQINSIIPDREKNRLLVELTFYKKVHDDKTGAIISMDLITSRIYYYDLESDNYISWMEIPSKFNEKDGYVQHYVLLDIIKGKYLYFTSLNEDGSSQYLTITNENGYVIGEYDLNIDNSNIIYSSFFTSSPDGILSALLCTEYAGGITMWRTDKIIKEDVQ